MRKYWLYDQYGNEDLVIIDSDSTQHNPPPPPTQTSAATRPNALNSPLQPKINPVAPPPHALTAYITAIVRSPLGFSCQKD